MNKKQTLYESIRDTIVKNLLEGDSVLTRSTTGFEQSRTVMQHAVQLIRQGYDLVTV